MGGQIWGLNLIAASRRLAVQSPQTRDYSVNLFDVSLVWFMFVFIGFEKGGKLKSRVTPIMPRPETMIEIIILIKPAPYYFKLVAIERQG